MSFAAQLKQLHDVLNQSRGVAYSAVSALAFVIYDICEVFPLEYEHIWRAKWSVVKCLYLFARYYAFGYLLLVFSVASQINPSESVRILNIMYSITGLTWWILSIQFCKVYSWVFGLGGPLIFTTTVNVIFLMRVHALYHRNPKVLVLLILLLTLEFAGESYITIVVAIHETIFNLPITVPWPGCRLATQANVNTLIAWVPCLGVASVVLISMIISLTVKNPLAVIGIHWVVVVYSFCGSRLILNLRVAASFDSTKVNSSSVRLPTSSSNSALLRLHKARAKFSEFDTMIDTESHEMRTMRV
ncbi:hypothetical protein NLI96_g9676 [Meripilus lineatus]|uniref:DUF6533 domain-containing protein n=1 Tax=Meripilus lineatus TaxID=2056292 RepID=A0AAD5UZF8_9APHY|nr:hypothetical protein NLI96_g9676 [Physisporinus lineatus]